MAALFISLLAISKTEVTGKMTYEGSAFSRSGSTIGNFGNSTVDATNPTINPQYGLVTTTPTPSHSSGDLSKSEVKAQIFFDGGIKDSTFHVEVQGVFDGKAVDSQNSIESYTQREVLREVYVNTEVGDWLIRAGKQQVVWSIADGIKLLDTINPTDYSETAQNKI